MNNLRALSPVHDEVTQWFFDDYLAIWVAVGTGAIARGPDFILDYWSVPLHYATDRTTQWLLNPAEVVRVSAQTHDRLRGQGFASTAVPDHEVTVYHRDGAAIGAILSRCRTDGSEIDRQAAHFELARRPAGWRMIGIQSTHSTADSLNTAWLRSKGRHDHHIGT
ncbi:MAG: hypothetical protein QOH60_4172 [Mycobacterium sp.]|jgi:hypothetical protein|nr:hypothetical protein [Mycobacterium sp.]